VQSFSSESRAPKGWSLTSGPLRMTSTPSWSHTVLKVFCRRQGELWFELSYSSKSIL
jgi:hypothetical protein